MTEIRPIVADEVPAYLSRMHSAFYASVLSSEGVEARRPLLDETRSLGVFEDGALIGTGDAISLQLTLPGHGSIAAAGLASISILPTHRRRGLFTELLRRQIEEARAEGEAVAILFASEGGIYGQFGFGVATFQAAIRLASLRAAFGAAVDLSGLRMVERGSALELLQAIAERATSAQVGAVGRSPTWWRYASRPPAGGEPEVEAVVRAEEDGFVIYRRKVDESTWRGTLHVELLLTTSPAAYAALWRYCLDVDLIDHVVAPNRSVEEPLRFLLADPRAMESTVSDGLWLKLLDVEAALNNRGYAGDGRVVLQVDDQFCPWNSGSYAIEGGRCRRTDADAALAMPAAALGACYLGGVRFGTLAAAGVVRELRPGAAARADELFASGGTPWCPFRF